MLPPEVEPPLVEPPDVEPPEVEPLLFFARYVAEMKPFEPLYETAIQALVLPLRTVTDAPSGTTERMLPLVLALERSRTPPPPVPLTYMVEPLVADPPEVLPPEVLPPDVLPPEVEPPLVLPYVRYCDATKPLLPPQVTGCQPLLELPRRETLEPCERTVMTDPLMLAVLRQLRPPGALLTVAEPVDADELTEPPDVESPEVEPPLVLPELLRYEMCTKPFEPAQTTGCHSPLTTPRNESEVPSETTAMIEPL